MRITAEHRSDLQLYDKKALHCGELSKICYNHVYIFYNFHKVVKEYGEHPKGFYEIDTIYG